MDVFLRWPDDVDVDDVILDAAERCFTERGVSGVTVEEIAVAAGVSRITVYRRIGNRDQLVLLVLLRVTDRFLAGLRPRLIAESDLSDALTLLVRATSRAIRREDLRLLFASPERGAMGVPIPGVLAPMANRFGDSPSKMMIPPEIWLSSTLWRSSAWPSAEAVIPSATKTVASPSTKKQADMKTLRATFGSTARSSPEIWSSVVPPR